MTGVAPRARAKGIQSAGTGLRVLDALVSEAGPVTLTALSGRLGLSASQTHRYLASLVAAGMARQTRDGRYDLGPQAVRIGLAALGRIDGLGLADAAVPAFCAETGRTVLIAVEGPAGAVVVRWHAGRPPVVTSLTLGSVLPLPHSATGRIFLAYAPRGLYPIEERQCSAATLERVRAEAVAHVDATLIPGLRAVAMPVFDMQGRAMLAITAIANDAIPPEGDAAAEAALRLLCRDLTHATGGAWPVAG